MPVPELGPTNDRSRGDAATAAEERVAWANVVGMDCSTCSKVASAGSIVSSPPTYRQCHSPALQARSRPRSICVADLSPVVHAPGPATAGLTYGHFDATNQSAMFQVFKATDGHLMKLHSVGFTRSTVAVMNTGST